MNIDAEVLDGIHSLPPEKKIEVLDFIEFIRQRTDTPLTPRPIGLCQGQFIVPDDFDDPLPEDVLRDFET